MAVCYSRNQSRVTAQHGEVTLKISMCWFDSNYSSSESCSPFKFFHLKDYLPLFLNLYCTELLKQRAASGSIRGSCAPPTEQYNTFGLTSHELAKSKHVHLTSYDTAKPPLMKKSVLTIYGLLWRFFYNTSVTTWIRRSWETRHSGLNILSTFTGTELAQRLKSSTLFYTNILLCGLL